jgi:parallel beta-helix repeat protein
LSPFQKNTAELNIHGILIEQDCTGNTLSANSALTNRDADLEDDNAPAPSCPNTWLTNTFGTIDGAGAECIR